MSVRKGECVYCGVIGPITDDDIPPKCLFKKPRPALVKVPSCPPCNNSVSDDDENFRTMLALRHDLSGHEGVKDIRPATL